MGLSVMVRGPSQRLLQVSGMFMHGSPGSSEPLPSSPGAFWKVPCRSAHNGGLGRAFTEQTTLPTRAGPPPLGDSSTLSPSWWSLSFRSFSAASKQNSGNRK